MHSKIFWLCLLLAATPLYAQQRKTPKRLSISTKEVPKAFLWEPFLFRMEASGGTGLRHWRVISGSLPKDVWLADDGTLTGKLNDPGPFEFTVLVRDSSNPTQEQKQQFVLSTETPLTVDWQRKASANGQRIDGSVRVSNHTGRDLDLTFIVLAVNDIGRATAIGYQHFPLKRDTRDQELPFGENLSSGNYAVNVDVVGEEQISKRIFRARLVRGKESIAGAP